MIPPGRRMDGPAFLCYTFIKAPDVCRVCAHPQSCFEMNAENY